MAEKIRREQPPFSVEELSSEQDLYNYLRLYYGARNPEATPHQIDRYSKTSLRQLKSILQEQQDREVSHFLGVRAEQGFKAVGKVQITKGKDDVPWGYICDMSTAPEERGKGWADEIVKRAEEIARLEKAAGIYAYVALDNPLGLLPQLKNGLEVAEIDPSSFTLIKNFEADTKKKESTKIEWQEVLLIDSKKIGELLASGFRGVDIKNVKEKNDNHARNWVLILEKK